jgi:nucleobase:cation symporter-1, NCS1 family
MASDLESVETRLGVEENGINVIPESERKGEPRDLFWPWFASNVSVLGLSYASFLLFFGIGFWQALVAGVVGIVFSFLLTGFVSLAGKRGSAPTMVLSRAPFGVNGNALPTVVSYLLLVGWEIVLVSLATLATATVFARLGWSSGNATKVIAFVVVAGLVVAAGMIGFDLIMRLMKWITLLTIALTIGYILLTLSHIHWSSVSAVPGGTLAAFVGATIFAMTGFGLGWVNCGADYSRYLPRSSSGAGIVGWTTFGASLAPLILIGYGLLLAGSDPDLLNAVSLDPIGALTTILPTWYLVPFMIVVLLGLVGGAVLDIYSSGLNLLTLGLRIPRWSAAGIDGVLMIVGTIYFVWIADNFFYPFQGFLYTLGVPIAAWVGIFLGDMWHRKRDYTDADLYTSSGRYGSVGWLAVGLLLFGSFVGWGLVDNSGMASSLSFNPFNWQGYLFNPVNISDTSPWHGSNIGIFLAIVIGFLGQWIFGGGRVRRQEAMGTSAA